MSKGIEGSNPSLTASFLAKPRLELESASLITPDPSGLLWRTKFPWSVSPPALLYSGRPFEGKMDCGRYKL